MTLLKKPGVISALVVAIGAAGIIALVGWIWAGWPLQFRTFLAVAILGMPVVFFVILHPWYEAMESTRDPIDRFVAIVLFEVVVLIAFALSSALMP